PGLRHRARADRRADLLGPVVPGSGPPHGAGRGQRSLLPDGDRLAPRGEGRARRSAARRLADDAPRTRDRERHLRRRGQQRWSRGSRRRRDRVLGLLARLRSLRGGGGRDLAHRGGDPRHRLRSPPPGRGAAQLAVPAGPTHRRLRSHHQALARRMSQAGARSRTPAALGYRWPAEWEPHAATWLAWPHERSDWPGKFGPIPWVYGEVVRQLVPGERVRILVEDASTERQARAILRRVGVDLGRVDFFRIRTDRSWTRDFCPLL